MTSNEVYYKYRSLGIVGKTIKSHYPTPYIITTISSLPFLKGALLSDSIIAAELASLVNSTMCKRQGQIIVHF